jgi:hypothetical protein
MKRIFMLLLAVQVMAVFAFGAENIAQLTKKANAGIGKSTIQSWRVL